MNIRIVRKERKVIHEHEKRLIEEQLRATPQINRRL